MTAPSEATLKTRIDAAIDWVEARVADCDDANQKLVHKYPAMPLCVKLPNATDACDKYRHLGNENRLVYVHKFFGPGQVLGGKYAEVDSSSLVVTNGACSYLVYFFTNTGAKAYTIKAERAFNADGTITYTVTLVKRHIALTPSPAELWLGPNLAFSNLNTATEGSSVTYSAYGPINNNKYFLRGYTLSAAPLLQADGYTDYTKIDAFSDRWWSDKDYDWLMPMFGKGTTKDDDYIFHREMWQDEKFRYGCGSSFPVGQSSGFYGFCHKSKVILDVPVWMVLTTVDPLYLCVNATHLLNKYGDPDYQFRTPDVVGARDIFSSPLAVLLEAALWRYTSVWTPRKVAEYTRDYFYTPGLGVSKYIPVARPTPILLSTLSPAIAGVLSLSPMVDDRDRGFFKVANEPGVGTGLRTNTFLTLATQLGYGHNEQAWKDIADELAETLMDSQWGFSPYATYEGITEDFGTIRRPQFQGAQLIAWKQTNSLMMPNTNTLRRVLNEFGDQPEDDGDAIVSNVETTASFAQALRVYTKGKYGTGWPTGTNLPVI